MTAISDRTAPVDSPVLDVISDRWSPRIYDGSAPVDENALRNALEAARWAPSAFNRQPWRFLVTRRGTSAHARELNSLIEFNQGWAKDAGALVVVLTQTTDATGTPLPEAQYDAGQAAAYFTLQAHADGLHVHQMSGFDTDAVSREFSLADNTDNPDGTLVPLTVIAVGTPGSPADIDAAGDAAVERENTPRTRRPVADSVLVDD